MDTNSPDVTKIITIDPKTRIETVIFDRKIDAIVENKISSDVVNLTLEGAEPKVAQTQSVKIDDIRKTLNNRMNEIDTQRKEIHLERDLVKGEPLTELQAERLAVTYYAKGEDIKLEKQASELQNKRDQLNLAEKDNIAYGKEYNFDKTLWKYAPEMFKGEGLRYYESSLAIIGNNNKALDRQATEIHEKIEQLKERLNTPEAHVEIARKSEEYLAKDKERLAKLEPLDSKLDDLRKEQSSIMKLNGAMPSRDLSKEINVQGDVKEAKNILEQADLITQQLAEMQQTVGRARSRSR